MGYSDPEIAQGRKVNDGQHAYIEIEETIEIEEQWREDIEALEFEVPVWTADRVEEKCEIRVIDSMGNLVVNPYRDLLFKGFSFRDAERVSVTETNEGFVATFLDSKPITLTMQAIVYNAALPNNWRDRWINYYREYFRGSKLSERNASLYLLLDGLVIKGSFVDYAISEEGHGADRAVPINISMLTSGADIYPVTTGMKGASHMKFVYPEDVDFIIKELIANQKKAYKTKANTTMSTSGAATNVY